MKSTAECDCITPYSHLGLIERRPTVCQR